jgi:dihydroneopterin triphosphate diphosphatase
MKKKYRKAVFIVTYRKEENNILYLLLKRKLHWIGWEFPKGGIKPKESIVNAVRRELFEETGQRAVKIKRYPVKGKYKYPKFFPDRPGMIGQTYTLFSSEINDKKIKFDKKEHTGFKWASFKQALKLLTFPNKRKCLRIVERDLNKRITKKI